MKFTHGSYWVLIFGAFAFLYCGLSVMFTSNTTIGTWNFLGVFYWIFGFGRGAWESTNKATVASYFKTEPHMKDAAFAAIYFASGIAAATAYASFPYMSKGQIVTLCSFTPALAMLCFHLSYDTHTHEADEERLKALNEEDRVHNADTEDSVQTRLTQC